MSNNLVRIAREMLLIEKDLPFRFDYSENPPPTLDDFELYAFGQVWESTALGFGGIGGQAMTYARTYVFVPISCDQKCFVYFGGRFAYEADYCEKFREDLLSQNMEPVPRAGKYRVEGE